MAENKTQSYDFAHYYGGIGFGYYKKDGKGIRGKSISI